MPADTSRLTDPATLWLLAESYRDGADCLSQGCLLRHPEPILLLLREAVATVLAALRAAAAPPGGATAALVSAAEALIAAPLAGREPAPLFDLASSLLDAARDVCMENGTAEH